MFVLTVPFRKWQGAWEVDMRHIYTRTNIIIVWAYRLKMAIEPSLAVLARKYNCDKKICRK